MSKKHVVVLGGGPGGYAAAIYLAHLGAAVTLVERQHLGGTCLNVGCIPTKAFVEAANQYAAILGASAYGLKLEGGVTVDGKKLAKFKNGVVKQLRSGVAYLLSAAGVAVVEGTGSLTGPTAVQVVGPDGAVQHLSADAIVLATGSAEIVPSGLEPDGTHILNSTQMLDLQQLPERVAIIGGGVIGVEFASLLSRFGKQVTIIELTDTLLPTEDRAVAAELRRSLEESGVQVLTETRAQTVLSRDEQGITLALASGGGETRQLTADQVLVCVGRRANLDGIGLEAAGVRAEGRYIPTDSHMRTNVPGIYAVGDLTASPQLAHVAYHEARIAALDIAGGGGEQADYSAVPYCIFSHPEVARVGLTEEAARAQYPALRVETESFSGNGKAMIHRENAGFVKLLIDGATERVVGCSIIGPKATELIAEPTLAVKLGLEVGVLSTNINAHPSLSELIGETAAAAVGLKLHAV